VNFNYCNEKELLRGERIEQGRNSLKFLIFEEPGK
jgi:hypothetical protein